MCQYVNFYARYKGGQFVPIADYTRGTRVYQEMASQIPYGKLKLLKREEIREIAARIRAGKEFSTSQIDECNEKIKLIAKMNNSLEEKLGAIDELKENISEYEEELLEFEAFATELFFIANMTYNDIEIYAGIEAPAEPADEDVVSDF